MAIICLLVGYHDNDNYMTKGCIQTPVTMVFSCALWWWHYLLLLCYYVS